MPILIPAKKTIEATDYVDRIVAQGLKESDNDDPQWYVIQHRRSYLGIVNLRQLLEYMNELRSQDMNRASEIQNIFISNPTSPRIAGSS